MSDSYFSSTYQASSTKSPAYSARTSPLLASLDNLGARLFFELPLYLGHRKTTYILDDIGIWLLCKPLGFVDKFIRNATSSIRTRVSRARARRTRRKRSRKSYSDSSTYSRSIYNERGRSKEREKSSFITSSGGYETCSTGSYNSSSIPSSTSLASEKKLLPSVQDTIIAHHDNHQPKHDDDLDLALAYDNNDNNNDDIKTVSSNSWSKWSESVTDGSTWLKSMTSTIWEYGSVIAPSSGYGSKRTQRKRGGRSVVTVKRGGGRLIGRRRAGGAGWRRYVTLQFFRSSLFPLPFNFTLIFSF